MPDYLVERINATLAAEQARRGATLSGASVAPLLAPARRRSGRLVLAVAGAAAAVALFAVVGNLLQASLSPETSSVTSAAPGSRAVKSQIPAGPRGDAFAPDKAAPPAAPPVLQIQQSGTQYTPAGFKTQARNLVSAGIGGIRPSTAGSTESSGSPLEAGPIGTTSGLIGCLNAIGARGAQVVRADLAFYEGRPAVIIVATANGTTKAYAVGRRCSHGDAALLRPATALP